MLSGDGMMQRNTILARTLRLTLAGLKPTQIAERLGTTPASVRAAKSDLRRKGLLPNTMERKRG
jgi:Mn-dependent DtxR family transcriptional regulator